MRAARGGALVCPLLHDRAMKSILILLAAASITIAACGGKKPADGPAERAGEKVDEAAKDTKDATKEAAEDTEEAAEDAKKDVKKKD